jgi:leukotriene-A4 hydrolase
MEQYLTPYEWQEYNILVLPPGFPFGGMENPCLTFVTPALIAGDKSLASVIAHEISHSWTGNLVTNKDWRNFWLNEGFTMFLQRKIIEKVYGEDNALLSASIGYKDLLTDIATFGENHSYTSLHPDIQRVLIY